MRNFADFITVMLVLCGIYVMLHRPARHWRRARDKTLLALACLIIIVGCALPGKIASESQTTETTRTLPDGTVEKTTISNTRRSVTSPSAPVTPASLQQRPDGSWTSSTGNTQKNTPALIAAGQTWVLYLIGGVLILMGALALAFKSSPFLVGLAIPTTAGTYLITAGAGVILLTIIGMQIPWWAWLAAVTIAAVIVLPSWWATKKDKQKLLTNGALE